MSKHNTITQYVVRYKCNFFGVKKDEPLVYLPTFERANRFLRGFLQTQFLENPKVSDALVSPRWNVDPTANNKTFKWELRNKTYKNSYITIQIYVRVIERASNCGTCFHATWDCERCMLGRREINNRNIFTCPRHLPLSDVALSLINEFRFKENLDMFGGKEISERPMTQADLNLILAKEREARRKALC